MPLLASGFRRSCGVAPQSLAGAQHAHGAGTSVAVSLTGPKPSAAVVVRDLAGGRPERTPKLVIFVRRTTIPKGSYPRVRRQFGTDASPDH